jgi:transcriptional regulator with XRE-family HTH domain
MDTKRLGERLRLIRKDLGISQQQLAKATNLTQPAVSRLENGEQVYASALLSVFDFYRDKVSLDHLLDPDLDTSDNTLLYCRSQERRQKFDNRLSAIAHDLEESLEQISALRDEI